MRWNFGEEARELGGEFSKHAGVDDADSDFRLRARCLLGELEVDILELISLLF